MRYKGEYSPSYLADPQDYTWHPFEECKILLDRHHYACFTHPEKSLDAPFKGPRKYPTRLVADNVFIIPLFYPLSVENPTWSESDLGELYQVDSIKDNGIEIISVIVSPQISRA